MDPLEKEMASLIGCRDKMNVTYEQLLQEMEVILRAAKDCSRENERLSMNVAEHRRTVAELRQRAQTSENSNQDLREKMEFISPCIDGFVEAWAGIPKGINLNEIPESFRQAARNAPP